MGHHPRQSVAFAEGRRLREAAETRRRAMRHVAGHRGRYRPAPRRRRRWPLLLLVPLAAAVVVLATIVAVLVTIGMLVAKVAVPIAFALVTVAVVAAGSRRRAALRRGGAPGTAPLPARPAAAPRPDLVWQRARERFHSLRAEYAAFECDPMQVLRLPALADVSVASTGRFVDAFAEAQALETDAFPPGTHAGAFVAAVDRAERAWRAAREAAERIRLSNLTPVERGTVERVIKLLMTARDSDSDPERLAAYARARSELAKLDRAGAVHLPRTAQAALDAAARGALPA